MKNVIKITFGKTRNMILCIIACVLILSISLEGTTFAWLYDSTVAYSSRDFQFAEVNIKCEKDDVQNLEFMNFNLLKDFEFAKNFIRLETDLSHADKDDWNNIFELWWNDNRIISSNSYLVPTNKVLLGNVIRKKYTFTNISSIPAYLRIDSPKVFDMSVNVAYFIDMNGEETAKDGKYWYFLKPLAAEESITLEVIAYVPQLANVSSLNFIGTVDITIDHAEVIQATNNAVYFADGWNSIAADNRFKTYIEK